jgi:hypothetical protein
MKIAELAVIHPFVRRQVADSKFGHYDGDFEDIIKNMSFQDWELAEIVDLNGGGKIRKVKLGNSKKYYSSVVKIDETTPLITTFDQRQDGEESHIGVVAKGDKMPAKSVTLIFYSREALDEEVDIDGDYFLVSINASPFNEDFPMHPVTMARNQMDKEGGTKRDYTPQEWAEAVWFWSQHALASENA